MGTGASSLPHVEGFGTTGGVRIDRSSRLDLPWKTLLAEIGDADVEMLQQMADECSDEELHCCRAFFRAFRALSCKNLENEELHRQMYFVAAQSPKSLLVFYSILHQCALLGVESLEPIPELASEFVQTALDSYVAEKNFENVLEVEEVNVDAMRGIICAYVEELLDILTNSALAEPQCSVVDGETQFMLEYDLLQVCLGAHGASVVNLRVGENLILVRAEENEKQIFRCASSPENSSLINQTFYLESTRREFMLEPDGVLLIRQTSSESLPVSFLCTSAKVAEFCSSTESTTLVELGTIAGVAQVAGANVRVRLMDGKRIVLDGSTNWLVKLKFVLEKESSIS